MSTAAVSSHSGTGPLSLMSCVRESSPLQDAETDVEKSVASKKKFWNRIRWFKRKNNSNNNSVSSAGGGDSNHHHHHHHHHRLIDDPPVIPIVDYVQASDALRSRSTSELSIEDQPRKRNTSAGAIYPGLSVSHDSVFHSPNSGSETDLEVARSSSSLCIPNRPQADLQLELSERLRLRRSGGAKGDTSEDDEGLPRSPCNSPTTTDTIDKTASLDLPNKSHSTCSDGSLLSVASSDNEEDSYLGQIRHPSRSSLSESHQQQGDSDVGVAVPLNHSAAHHRVSVRPKKTHGAPKRKRGIAPITLPTTLEVNEESAARSASPDKDRTVAPSILTENQLKSSSLPPGLAAPKRPPTDDGDGRRGFAASKSQDALFALDDRHHHHHHLQQRHEQVVKEEKASFFERLFPRRSAKKKKTKQESKKEDAVTSVSVITEKHSEENYSSYRKFESKPLSAVRSGAAYRQRVQPLDVQPPDEVDDKPSQLLPDVVSTSPLQIELENKLRHRSTTTTTTRITPLDTPDRIKLLALSSLQQRKPNDKENNDDGDDDDGFHNFKSLTDFPSAPETDVVHLIKSYSFKSTARGNADVAREMEERMAHRRWIPDLTATAVGADNLDEQISRCFQRTKTGDFPNDDDNDITISGPSHTAVVSVTMEREETTTHHHVTKINVEPSSCPRKFSRDDDVEIVEKDAKVTTPPVGVGGPLFKKNEKSTTQRRSFVSITPESPSANNTKSISSSFDSLISETDKSSSQDSLDKPKVAVVLRKKSSTSSVKGSKDEEPELMKVFARRSLKLKDSDNETLSQQLSVMLNNEDCDKTRDSDKENITEPPAKLEDERTSVSESETEVTLRKSSIVEQVRSMSDNSQNILRKQFMSRRKTDNWITTIKNEEKENEKTSTKREESDAELIIEPKNFNQRKAEWEKRAQEAQKKSTP